MIDLYTFGTPNGRKISIALEELALPYTAHAVDIMKGEQFAPAFLAVSPNNKIPALVDRRGAEPVTVFESGAILVHLAESTPGGERLLPSTSSPAARAEVMAWLMWQMAGLGPMMGRAGRFTREKTDERRWVLDEFLDEVERLWAVLDGQLAKTGAFIAGDHFSIADIASYTWMAGGWGTVWSPYGALSTYRPSLARFTHIPRWLETVAARPAVARGMAVPAPKKP
jgi:GST-like protein